MNFFLILNQLIKAEGIVFKRCGLYRLCVHSDRAVLLNGFEEISVAAFII